jgi:hypothetical protein
VTPDEVKLSTAKIVALKNKVVANVTTVQRKRLDLRVLMNIVHENIISLPFHKISKSVSPMYKVVL